METLTYHLKQHTPLIDFQHYQKDSTLRASEVKPQLDRFVLTKLGKGNYQDGCKEAKTRGWLIQDTNALNYRMRILPTSPGPSRGIQNAELKQYPNFFGNMFRDEGGVKPTEDEKWMREKHLTFREDLELKLFFPPSAACASLKAAMEENAWIAKFFFRTNFGNRVTKGFGSYYLSPEDSAYVSPRKLAGNAPTLVIEVDTGKDRFFQLFRDINTIYTGFLKTFDWYGLPREALKNGGRKASAATRMSPLLFKPIFNEDYSAFTVYLLFRDKKIRLRDFKNTVRVTKDYNGSVPAELTIEEIFRKIAKRIDFDVLLPGVEAFNF